MKKQNTDMQVNVSGIRRNIKNFAHNYSDAQVKVREATSNDPWGPSATIMAEIADLTYNVVAFSEIMQMIWKRINDHGKNWRHVYKSLILLEYLIKTGTEKVAQQCKENVYVIQTLREFQHLEEGKDQGMHVREKAKQLVSLLKDDERLKNERAKALKAKERFAQHASGFGSDGSIDGPTQRDTPTWLPNEEPRAAPDIEFVRPQTAGEEELQLQLAMAMSREEAEQEEAKRRSDDVRLQLALSQSEQDFKQQDVKPGSSSQQSHLLDLLDINLGATGGNSAPEGWGVGPPSQHRPKQTSDPWTSSPPSDPWQPLPGGTPIKVPTPFTAAENTWLPQPQSPSIINTNASVEGWLQNSVSSTNGNTILPSDPWLISKPSQPTQANSKGDPWLASKPVADPWLPATTSNVMNPWTLSTENMSLRPSPVGAITSPNSDLDEFDIITNRSKSAQSATSPLNGNNNNSLLDDLDPISPKNNPQSKTPQSFLGENSALVNLDFLIKPNTASTNGDNNSAPYNPFSEANSATSIPQRNNLFQQQIQPLPSINQLKQSPFPVTLNQDPWAPISNSPNTTSQYNNNTSRLQPESAASNPFLS